MRLNARNSNVNFFRRGWNTHSIIMNIRIIVIVWLDCGEWGERERETAEHQRSKYQIAAILQRSCKNYNRTLFVERMGLSVATIAYIPLYSILWVNHSDRLRRSDRTFPFTVTHANRHIRFSLFLPNLFDFGMCLLLFFSRYSHCSPISVNGNLYEKLKIWLFLSAHFARRKKWFLRCR